MQLDKNANLPRCAWCTSDKIYRDYHDKEWGVPVYSERHLFAALVLEGAQAGLAWLTVLKKREHYWRAFANFDIATVANFNQADKQRLLHNKNLIRHRQKIAAAIGNAQVILQLQAEFGSFSTYLWRYVDYQPIVNHYQHSSQVPATTALASAVAKDLKQRGMSFVGPIIVYSFMQAVGMVNDHTLDCYLRQDSKN